MNLEADRLSLRTNQMTGEGPLSRVMGILRVVTCILSFGFVFPHAFASGTASEPVSPKNAVEERAEGEDRRASGELRGGQAKKF